MSKAKHGLRVRYHSTNKDGLDGISKIIDQGWRYFWAQRGRTKPPVVSSHHWGGFVLPNEEIDGYEMNFSNTRNKGTK